jgi:CrcB protein
MTRILLVALGGAIGATARYGLGVGFGRLAPAAQWPLATLTANLAGGLLMGLLAGWLAHRGGADQEQIRLFAAVGVLGGFTTFSAFSLETVLMIEKGRPGAAAAYVGLSVAGAVAALFVGLFVARRLFGAGA